MNREVTSGIPATPMEIDEKTLKEAIKVLIIECARLKIPPPELKDDQPLFDPKAGPGLDSIDVLEIVVNLERNYGVTIPDKATGESVLKSVNTICEFVKSTGTKS